MEDVTKHIDWNINLIFEETFTETVLGFLKILKCLINDKLLKFCAVNIAKDPITFLYF